MWDSPNASHHPGINTIPRFLALALPHYYATDANHSPNGHGIMKIHDMRLNLKPSSSYLVRPLSVQRHIQKWLYCWVYDFATKSVGDPTTKQTSSTELVHWWEYHTSESSLSCWIWIQNHEAHQFFSHQFFGSRAVFFNEAVPRKLCPLLVAPSLRTTGAGLGSGPGFEETPVWG